MFASFFNFVFEAPEIAITMFEHNVSNMYVYMRLCVCMCVYSFTFNLYYYNIMSNTYAPRWLTSMTA